MRICAKHRERIGLKVKFWRSSFTYGLGLGCPRRCGMELRHLDHPITAAFSAALPSDPAMQPVALRPFVGYQLLQFKPKRTPAARFRGGCDLADDPLAAFPARKEAQISIHSLRIDLPAKITQVDLFQKRAVALVTQVVLAPLAELGGPAKISQEPNPSEAGAQQSALGLYLRGVRSAAKQVTISGIDKAGHRQCQKLENRGYLVIGHLVLPYIQRKQQHCQV